VRLAGLKNRFFFGIIISLLLPTLLQAKLEDVDGAEEKARNDYINQFIKFTQDKNVQGKARDPRGKAVPTASKERFNADDHNTFKSELTYHDYVFSTTEEKTAPDGTTKTKKKLPAFISEHGGIVAAAGSSALERKVYDLDKKFSEQLSKTPPKDEVGVSYFSIFKETTQEIFEKGIALAGGAPPPPPKNGQPQEKEKRSRLEIRSEAKKEIEKVGEDSFETIRESGRDEDQRQNPNALDNGVLLRVAAGDATTAMWNSTLANLSQRRANKGMENKQISSEDGGNPQLSEGMAKCKDWSKAAFSSLAAIKDPAEKDKLTKEFQRMESQCEEMAKLPFDAIDPRFVDSKTPGGKAELKEGGPRMEDSIQRDLRVQLEVLDKAGISLDKIPSNWKYSDQDNRAKVITFDDNAPKTQALTVAEQLDSYNNQLDSAEKGYKTAAKKLVKFRAPKPTKFKIQPETKTIMEINQPPPSAYQELGVDAKSIKLPEQAETYQELVDQQ
jgi:hypothetical protein